MAIVVFFGFLVIMVVILVLLLVLFIIMNCFKVYVFYVWNGVKLSYEVVEFVVWWEIGYEFLWYVLVIVVVVVGVLFFMFG